MIRAAGEPRNSAACATSSGVAKSSGGYPFLDCSNTCGLRRTRASHAGVFTVPGSTMLARAPSRPYSIASDFVSLISPALAAL